MKILVVGSGGREHALAWRLARSPSAREVLAAPGNPGIESVAKCFPVAADDFSGLLRLVAEEKVDFTVVGPEAQYAAGIVDKFAKEKRFIFGPTAAAARLESSKAFAKRLMAKHKIPTAEFRVFDHVEQALGYVAAAVPPLVVKADGLAAGKGVTVCRTTEEAVEAVKGAMERRSFGDSGARVVVEECLTGPEVSVMALTDGERILAFPPAQDHKRVGDGDTGPNTGGMGAFCPVPAVGEDLLRRIETEILVPIVHAMKREGHPFSGLLYAGLMLTPSGPKVIEFNVRFGDPETQVLLPLVEGDFAALLAGVARGRLEPGDFAVASRAAACVVAASGGYPGPFRKGEPIAGLEDLDGEKDVLVFHAGTARDKDGRIVTAGGRVLGITATGSDVRSARDRAYRAAERIRFAGMHYRKDIAARAAGSVA